MKHRFPSLLLAGALVLSLTSCTPTVEAQPSPAADTPVPAASPTPEPFATPGGFPEADSLPLGKYEPWQRAYTGFLSQLVETEAELRQWAENATSDEIDAQPDKWGAYGMSSDLYRLYDVDKDGVPELFVQYGYCEAAYETTCYTFREGEVTAIGDFPSGHVTLCTCPGENGFLFLWAHLGASHADRYVIENGELVNQGEIYTTGLDAAQMGEYPEPGEIWEGAEEITSYYTRTCVRLPDSGALLLPICDYDRSLQQAPQLTEEAQVREAIGKVLWDGAELFGVSGDNFYGPSGLMTLEEYLNSDTFIAPMVIEGQAWADANGDGQTDCILRMYLPERNWDMDFHLVLSWQNGQVYGYFFDGIHDLAVDPDGSVYFRDWDGWRQVSFYKEQCYTFPSPDPVVGDGLSWENFG